MSGISHQQAIQCIHRRLDGLLNQEQGLSLDEHLRSCEECRVYASEMELLPLHLRHEFHTRWDRKQGPSHQVMEQVTTKAKRIPMSNRFSSGVRLLAGVAALLLLAIVMNYIIPTIQNGAGSRKTETPLSPTLKIDPQSCKAASELNSTLRPPNDLYGYELIQGTSLVDGDFTYDFWLYCDPSLKPDEKENLNIVAGLGISSSWRYDGPNVEGPVNFSYGFEPNVSFGGSGSSGPLYKAVSGARFGIDLPKATIRAHIQQGTPIQFRVVVNSSLGQNVGIFSFRLEPTEHGLKVVNLHVEAEHLPTVAGNLIAFASDQNGNSDIYTMHADGTGLNNITNNPASDDNPSWSPDGKRLAFESDRNGSRQIYLMNADGSNVVQLTDDETNHFLPMNIHSESNPWSPSGSQLLFLQEEAETATWILYSLNVDSKSLARLAAGRVQFNNISWSPDGKHIGYVLNDSPTPDSTFVTGLYVVDAEGSNLLAINQLVPQTDSLDSPAYHWSRDGSSIIFIAYRHLDEGKDQWIAYEAVLDGRQLVERASSSTRMEDWWEGTAFIGGDLSTLTWLRSDGTFSTFKPLEACQATGDGPYGFMMRRSPSGSQVINIYCPNAEMWFYYANSDGTIIKPLIGSSIPSFTVDNSATSMTWSTDDQFVAVTLVSPYQSRMYILNVKNPSARPEEIVISNDELYEVPSWQP